MNKQRSFLNGLTSHAYTPTKAESRRNARSGACSIAEVMEERLLFSSIRHGITGGNAVNGQNVGGGLIASLTSAEAPQILGSPRGQTVTAGNSAGFSAAASGSPAPTLQWQSSTDGGATFSDIPGATSSPYTFTALAAQNQAQFRAVFTNSSGSATSAAAVLVVLSAPAITANPQNSGGVANATVTFTVAASGNPTPSVLWQVRANGAGTFSDIPGATSTTLSVTAQQTNDQSQYRAVFTNSLGSATSPGATLTYFELPAISTNPSSATVPLGQTASFSASAFGTDPFRPMAIQHRWWNKLFRSRRGHQHYAELYNSTGQRWKQATDSPGDYAESGGFDGEPQSKRFIRR
jgi:hypothetical protein